MAQIKIYGLKSTLSEKREHLSQAIHEAVISALEYPVEKKFHRFIGLERCDFIHPEDRSDQYVLIEILMFTGRSQEAKKQLICELFSNIEFSAGITAQDVEITIIEMPRENWGIRGLPGDALALNYQVNV